MSFIGVYSTDITPPLGMDFIGYHRPKGIQSILDQLYATAFVFEYQDKKSILISVDNIGMLVHETTIMRDRVANALGITRQEVTILYTHTHSGPETVNNDPVVLAYKCLLIEQVVQSAVQANQKLQPCEVGWGMTNGNIGVNRREMGQGGKVKMGTNPEGPVDPRIGVLALKHVTSGEMLGALVFCTAHPNVLRGDSFSLSGDYPGRTRRILEETLDCPVVIIQGAAGNVNARWRGSLQAMEHMAYAVSGHVLTILPELNYQPITKLNTVSDNLAMKLKEIPEPDDINKMAALAEEQWEVNTSTWRAALLEAHQSGQKELTIELEVQLFQLNEGSFAGIPMEPFSELAITIKNQLNNDLAFFGGYTNGYLGYLPTMEAFPYGGYEVELNSVVYGPLTGLWMPPLEDTSRRVVNKVLELHHTINSF